MGVEGLVGGLFGLASAAVTASSARSAQAANAAAQSELNQATMDFNRVEAEKARTWSENQAIQEQAYNAQQAEIARQFTERMSNSAHQREMADYKAAGLNPILAANSGAAVPNAAVASSSIPVASAASVSGLKAPHKENYVGAFVNTAMESMRLSNDLKRAKASVTEAEAAKLRAEIEKLRQSAEEKYINQQINTLKADENWKNWQSKTEEEKVNLVKQQIIASVEHVRNEKRLTDAEISKAGAIAYQAVKNADTEAAYKSKMAQIAESKSDYEKAKLSAEADSLRIDLFSGKKKLDREFHDSNFGRGIYILDKVVGAISPIKIFGN